MPLYQLDDDNIAFPPVNSALEEPNGLLAVGGDLSVERLLSAYSNGIFPWYMPNEVRLWWSPDPRAVLFITDLHVGRTLKKRLKHHPYKITLNHAFDKVITACANRDESTWIGPDILYAYKELHRIGRAHSIEVWQNETLVGGLYGVSMGSLFCGESMFSHVDDGSKIAFVTFYHHFVHHGGTLFDCQVLNHHTASLGACEISRAEFINYLSNCKNSELNNNCWLPQTLPAVYNTGLL